MLAVEKVSKVYPNGVHALERFSAENDLCAFRCCVLDVFENFFDGALMNERTGRGFFVEATAEFVRRHFLFQGIDVFW